MLARSFMAAAHDVGLGDSPTTSAPATPRYRADQIVASRYRLVRPLACSATGELWIAQPADLNNEVLVKFLGSVEGRDEAALQAAEERFKLEGQIRAQLAQLTKHIVGAIDWGAFEGVPYLVTEYVRGETLEQELRGGPMAAARVIRILGQ